LTGATGNGVDVVPDGAVRKAGWLSLFKREPSNRRRCWSALGESDYRDRSIGQLSGGNSSEYFSLALSLRRQKFSALMSLAGIDKTEGVILIFSRTSLVWQNCFGRQPRFGKSDHPL